VLIRKTPQLVIIVIVVITRIAVGLARVTVLEAKNSMKSISAIHPVITENTENILMKLAPHILYIKHLKDMHN